jgi:hypothetical protein
VESECFPLKRICGPCTEWYYVLYTAPSLRLRRVFSNLGRLLAQKIGVVLLVIHPQKNFTEAKAAGTWNWPIIIIQYRG